MNYLNSIINNSIALVETLQAALKRCEHFENKVIVMRAYFAEKEAENGKYVIDKEEIDKLLNG